MKTYAAVLKSVVGEFEISYFLPNAHKATVVKFTEKNKFEAEVPTELNYRDDFGQVRLANPNFAKEILNNYKKELVFVKELKKKDFVESDFPTVVAEVVEPKTEIKSEEISTPKKGK